MGDSVQEISDGANFIGGLFSQFSGLISMLVPEKYQPLWNQARVVIPAALNGLATVAHDVGVAQSGAVMAAHVTQGQPNAPALSPSASSKT